jgi:hypothetical protein
VKLFKDLVLAQDLSGKYWYGTPDVSTPGIIEQGGLVLALIYKQNFYCAFYGLAKFCCKTARMRAKALPKPNEGEDKGGACATTAAEFLVALADLIENRPPAALRERMRGDRALVRTYDFQRRPVKLVIALREDF